ncbi:hypothetical protein SLEP1_g34476 [Rubroshorea leprosula]|uniref:Uncharacterized protein n=1 Tax=Rubroshorea leprosula TaxID=152421 RepID=A0AAV5KK10_9ROSI|nr:hypothetical protein SLEP1_g34476 [Rubroshorea leprosula]
MTGFLMNQRRSGFLMNQRQSGFVHHFQPFFLPFPLIPFPLISLAMIGFMRNPDLLWVCVESRAEQTWVRRREPKANLGSSQTQVCSALGSTRTQSRSGFNANPEQIWVQREPRADLGSTRTQSRSGFVANPSLLCSALGSTRTQVCSGFGANPDLFWVRRKPISLLP